MSHFTDNLHLRKEIQRLLNENNQMKALLSEYRGPGDTGENIGGYNPLTPEERAEEAELEAKRKEAAKNITSDEITRIMAVRGITDKTPEEYAKELRKERFAIRQKAKDAAAAGARSAEDIQKDIESGKYKLSDSQKRRYEKEGTRYAEKLARGLSRSEEFRLRSGAKVTDQKDLERMKELKLPNIGSRFDAENIIRGNNSVQGAEDFVSSQERLAKLGKTAGDRFRAAQDETVRRNREEALRTSTGQKVRDFNTLVSGQQAQIKQFGQQMSNLRPETQERIQAAMRRGLSPGQAAQEELKRKQQLGVGQLETAKAREAASQQKLNDMESSYRAKYGASSLPYMPNDMSDSAMQDRVRARNSLTPEQQERARNPEARRKYIEDLKAGKI